MYEPDSLRMAELILGVDTQPQSVTTKSPTLRSMAYSDQPHPRVPQYTRNEIEQAIEAIQLLIRVRDRCRAQGLIDW